MEARDIPTDLETPTDGWFLTCTDDLSDDINFYTD
jgi:hypothetical protein